MSLDLNDSINRKSPDLSFVYCLYYVNTFFGKYFCFYFIIKFRNLARRALASLAGGMRLGSARLAADPRGSGSSVARWPPRVVANPGAPPVRGSPPALRLTGTGAGLLRPWVRPDPGAPWRAVVERQGPEDASSRACAGVCDNGNALLFPFLFLFFLIIL